MQPLEGASGPLNGFKEKYFAPLLLLGMLLSRRMHYVHFQRNILERFLLRTIKENPVRFLGTLGK